MSFPNTLDASKLCKQCNASQFSFKSTEELLDLSEIIGQERALESMRFGIAMNKNGYNLFVLGPYGMGKHTMVRQYLEQRAKEAPTPSDWCYVNNFKTPHKPIALEMEAGRGVDFKKDMDHLLEDLHVVLPTAFETDEYRAKVKEIEDDFEQRRETMFRELEQDSEKNSVLLVRTPSGFVFAPAKDGKPISPLEFKKLPESEQLKFENTIAELQERLSNAIQEVPEMRRELRNKIKVLNSEVAIFAVGHLIAAIRKKYKNIPKLTDYLEDYEENVIEHVDDFRHIEEAPSVFGLALETEKNFNRYMVNLLVDNSELKGAPVIFEDSPMYHNLVGRIEHMSRIGTLTTDFTLIKPGALHIANGGYLILDVRKLLLQPYAWEGLKRALYSKQIRIQSLAELFSMISTVTLDGESIPLDVKIVLLGDRMLYYMLLQYDPEFAELFKIAADFEEDLDRNEENNLLYARMIATIARNEELLAFTNGAVARIIEFSSRHANDASKLTTHMLSVVDLMRESDQWSRERKAKLVTEHDVQTAIDAQIRRVDRLRDNIQEDIYRKTLLIDTIGTVVGQVNALTVMNLGNFSFGSPTRITATTFLGEGKVVDISREVKMGGAIHSKGVLILSSFLTSRFGNDQPLSLSGSITFEQTYGQVEGDSASIAELCALLSVLANVPIKQTLAVTGSVNQLGQAQAIGGVNEKIEGFFDTCKSHGLTGEQGVLIPSANVKHLMLRHDVVTAAEKGNFHIYAIESVDDAISLLTGKVAGEKDADGNYPEDSINHRIVTRIKEMNELRKRFMKSEDKV